MISENEEILIPKEEPSSEDNSDENKNDQDQGHQHSDPDPPPPPYFYALVGNIPPHFRSSELRNYFSATAEADKVHCFHFRHRPQIVRTDTDTEDEDERSSKRKSRSPLCSVVRFSEEAHLSDFVQKYHGKFWMDKTGNEIHGRCIAQKVRLSTQELVKFRKELVPPRFMPKGNVGTKNSYFLNLIKECVLPASLIKKLNLEFPRGRSFKKYSKVPFNYETGFSRRHRGHVDKEEEDENIYTAKGHLISSTSAETEIPTPSTSGSQSQSQFGKSHDHPSSGNDSDPNEDEDLCEEWERHEALNNDVTSQERSKERLYEEEIELVWEKGGPGIVWYTDAQYWDAQRGNFDERSADDLDVDMEGYYTPGGGDKDARDMLEMRQSERFRNGKDDDFSVFKRPSPKQPQQRLRRSPSPPTSSRHSKKTKIGEFELHTKGFGRKLMEKQGWKDGVGLGTTKNEGIPDALTGDGQAPRDKRGFGYYGEKIEWGSKSKRPKHSHSSNPFGLDEDDRVVIGTIYDKPKELDRGEPLLRSNAPTFIKRY